MAKEKNTKDNLPSSVRKAHEAIAITPKSGKLTLLTRKLYNAQLIAAQKQGKDRETYRSPLKDIVANASYDSKDIELIKQHLRQMIQTKVEWNSLGEDDNRRWGVSVLLAEAEIIEDKATGMTQLEWSYPPKLKARLLDPSVYARISLQFMNKLRSGQAFSLYEICARYCGSPGMVTNRATWEWWRPVLTGVPDDSPDVKGYREYKIFKRDVIKPAISEVNSMTDLTVELIEHKAGRRVVEIQFGVAKKVQSALPFGDAPLFDMALLSQLMSLGASQADAEHIYVETEEGTLRAALKEVARRQSNKKLPPLGSPWAYFKTLLKSGTIKAEEPKKLPSKPKVTHEEIAARYLDHKRDEARAMFREMLDEDKDAWLDKYRANLELEATDEPAASVVLDELGRKGLKSKRAEVGFFTWLAEETWGKPTEKDLLDFVLNQGSP